MQLVSKKLEKFRVAFSKMVLLQDNKLQLVDLSLALRTALNMAFIGTNEAAYAAMFVEQYIPFGMPLSDEAHEKIVQIIEKLEIQSFPVFERE